MGKRNKHAKRHGGGARDDAYSVASGSTASSRSSSSSGGNRKRQHHPVHPDLAKHETYPQITNRDICKLGKIFGIDTRAWKPHMKVSGGTFLATVKSQMRVAIQPFIAAREEMKFMYNLYAHFPSLPKPKDTGNFELWLRYFIGWLSALNNVQNITTVLQNPSEVVVNTTRMDPRDMLAPLDDYLFGMNKDGSPGDGSNNVQVLGVNVHDVYPTYRRYLQPNAVLVMIQILSPDGTKVPLLDEVLCMVNTTIHRQMSPRTNPLLLAHQLNTLLHWFDVIDHDDTVQFLDELTAVMNARNIYLPCPFAANGAQVLNNVASMTRFWTIKPFLGTFFQNPRDLSNLYVTDEFRLITISTLIKSHALTSTIALAILQQLTRVVPSDDRVYTNGDIFEKAMRVIRTGTYPSGNLHPLGTGPMDSPCPITTMSVKKRYMALCIAECFVELQMRAFIRCGRIDANSNAFLWHSLFTKAPVHFESVIDSIVSGNGDLANVPMQLIYDLDIQLKMGTAHLDTRYAFAVPSQSLEPAVVDPLRTIEMYVGILIAKGLVDFSNINDLSVAYYESLRGHLDVMPKTQVVWTPTFPNFFPGFRHDLCPRYENELNKLLQQRSKATTSGSSTSDNKLTDSTARLLVKYSQPAHRVSGDALTTPNDTVKQKQKEMAEEDLRDLEKHIAAINGVGIYRRRDHLADLVRRYTGDCMMTRLGNSQNRERVRYLQADYTPTSGTEDEGFKEYWKEYNALLGKDGDAAIEDDRDVLKDVSKAANEVIHRVRGSNYNMMSVLRYDPNKRVARLGNPARDGAAPIDALSTSVAAVGIRGGGAIGGASDAGTSFPGSVNLADPASEPSLLGTLRDVHSLVRRVMGLRLDDERSRGMIRAGIRSMDVPAEDDTGDNAFELEYKRNMYMDVIQESIQEEYKRSKCSTLGDREDSIVDLAMKPSESGEVRRGAFGTDRDMRLLEEERRMFAENQKYGHATRHHIMLLDTIRSYVFTPQTSRFSSDTGSAGYDWDAGAYGDDGILKDDYTSGSAGQRASSIDYMGQHESMLAAVQMKHRIERLGYGVRNGVHPTVICVLRDVPARLQFDEKYMPWLSDCRLSVDLIHADVAQAVILAHNISLENLLFVMAVMQMDVLSMYVSFCAWTNNVRVKAPQMHTENRPLQMAHFVRFLMKDRGYKYNFVPEKIKGKFQFFRNALTKKYFEALNNQQNYAIRLTRCMNEVSLERKWYVCKKLIEWIDADHTTRKSILEPIITYNELNSAEAQKLLHRDPKQRPLGWQFDTDMLFQAVMHKLFFDDACNIANSSESKLDDFFSASDGSERDTRTGDKRRPGFSKLRIDAGNVIDAITDTNVVLNPLFQYDENQHRFVLDQTKLLDDDRGSDETDATIIVTALSKIREVIDDNKYARYRDMLRKMETALSAIHGNTYVTLKDASVVEASHLHPVATSVSPQPVYIPWWSHHDTVVFVNQCLWSVLNIRRQVEAHDTAKSTLDVGGEGHTSGDTNGGEVISDDKFEYGTETSVFESDKMSSVTRYLFTRPSTKLADEVAKATLTDEHKYKSLFEYTPSVKVMEEIARERGARSNLSAENIYDLEMAYTKSNKLITPNEFKIETSRPVKSNLEFLKSINATKKYTGKVMLHYVNADVILPSRLHVWLLAYRDTFFEQPTGGSKSLSYYKLPKVIETMFTDVVGTKAADGDNEDKVCKLLIENANLYLDALWKFVKTWVEANATALSNALTLVNVTHDDEEKRRTLVAMEAALGIHVIQCRQISPANVLQLPYAYMEKDTGESNAMFTLRNMFNVAAIDDYFDYSKSKHKLKMETTFSTINTGDVE